MSFLAPLALLAGLLAIPIVLLYFLKLKRPQHVVASTLLWRKVLDDLRVNSPFQRLKSSLLLLLQLLLLAALVLALARPLVRLTGTQRSSMIVLIDVSASMGAREPDGKTRFDLARAALRELVDRMTREDQMMLIAFSNQADILCSFTANHKTLEDAIDRLQLTERPTDIAEALTLVRSLARTAPQVRLAILSDGSFPDPSSEALELPVHFQRIGTPRPNVAISGLDIRRGLKDPQLIELFVELQNFGQGPVAGNLNVFLNQTQLDTKYFTIDAGQSRSQIFEADLPEGGDVRLELDVKDALAADNQAWQVVAPPKPRRVLLVGRPSYFLERVFRASQTVAVDTVASAPDDATAAGYSAVLWNRVEQPGIAPTHNIYLGCFPTLPGLVAKPTVKNPPVVDWDNGHPINRFNDYSDLLLPEAIPLVLPELGRPLLNSADFPLIALLQHERHALVILSFDPFTSNWPLLVSFPIFLHNCLGYFDTLGAQAANSNQLVGRTIVCPPIEPAPVLILPSGERVTLQRQGNADYAYSRVDHCGVYRLELDGQVTRTIAVNLFNPAESLLTPNEQPPLGANVATTGDLTQRVNREFTRPLLYAALGLLLLEFVFFHRRWLR